MYTYYFETLNGYKLTSKNDITINPTRVTASLITSLKKKKEYELTEILYSLHDKRFCSFCGTMMDNTQFSFNFELCENNVVKIRSAGAKKDREFGKYHVCISDGCYGRKLNANSVEFVSGAFLLTEQQAIEEIHKRNSSPFYRTNYTDDAEYIDYQKHTELTYEQRNFDKQVKTYNINKNNFINKFGHDKWAEENKKKDSSSYNYFLSISNNDAKLAKELFDNKNDRCKQIRPTYNSNYDEILKWWGWNYSNFVSNIDQFRLECVRRLSKSGIIGKCLFINNLNKLVSDKLELTTKNQYFFWMGGIIFGIDNFFEFLSIPEDVLRVIYKFNSKMYGYMYTVDGFCFRSDMEYTFYKRLKEINSVKILNVNKKYPTNCITGERKFYDFMIEYMGSIEYLEICCNIDVEYIDNQINKQKSFGCISILPKFFNSFFDDVSKNIILDKNKYYEYC